MLKKLFTCRFTVLVLILALVYVLINYVFKISQNFTEIFNAVYLSVAASFLVGVYFQYKLKDEISSEHLKIIEYKDEFNKSGILKYYSSFKNCTEDLRYDIRRSKDLIIYVAYGSTALNTISEEINYLLSKENSSIKIFFLDEMNPFVLGYSKLWGYSEQQLKNKISDSLDLLKNKIEELRKQNSLRGKLEIFKLKKYPIHFSFYFCDDILYFVPSKHYESKEFVPLTIKAQKTIVEGALYNKIKDDLKYILNAKDGIEKLN